MKFMAKELAGWLLEKFPSNRILCACVAFFQGVIFSVCIFFFIFRSFGVMHGTKNKKEEMRMKKNKPSISK